MNALQSAGEVEANVDSGSDDVLDDSEDFDVLNEWDLLCRIFACIACMVSVKISNRDTKVRNFVLTLSKFDMCPPLDIIN